MAVTQRQIAEALGVSHATVSQVLHGSRRSRISPQKQQEIRDLARSMGYRPRALTTHAVGYVLPIEQLRLLGESNFLVHAEAALSAAGFKLLLVEYKDDPERMRELLNSKTVDGVMLSRWYEGALLDVLGDDLPWVLMSTEDMGEMSGDRVTVDLEETIRGIVYELIGLGHTNICLVTGCLSVPFHAEQWDTLRRLCAGFPAATIYCSVVTGLDENLEVSLANRFREEDAPTALIAATPEKAIVAGNFLCRHHFQVPGDVSIVSLFDLPLFRALRPWLTATDAMGAEVAKAAVARLVERISDATLPAREMRIPGRIIQRDSLGPAVSNRTSEPGNIDVAAPAGTPFEVTRP